MRKRKLLQKVLGGSKKNVRFEEAVALVKAFGFRLVRITGSHHIFERPGISELLNLQNVKGQAKPYQLRQLLELVEQYNLSLGDNA